VNTINIFEVYETHMTRLQLRAAQKPQRSLFLAIGEFEEELAALRHVLKLQMQCLKDTAHVGDPSSFRDEPSDCSDRFSLENALIQRKYQDRRHEDEKLRRLEQRARALRSNVKEGIEVLDKGHGQAIRVFTLVTVFFLPL
jgi:PAS domain-containing protein